MSSFIYDPLPGRVVFGAGSGRAQLAGELERLGPRRLLVIASARDAMLASALTAPLAERVAGRFSEVRQHVPIEVAEQARALARELAADGLLAIGGGSAIGTAKAVALQLGLPIAAVPTTYAGSEMTAIYGITTGQRKETGRALAVLPRLVVYDPELTVSLPAAISGPSAMNAMAHCVEALYAPGANPVTTLLALEGMACLARGVPVAVARPADLAGRGETLYGAYLAGAALAVAGTSLHHKICHVLGGAYNLPHADLHTVILPHAVAYLAPAIPAAIERVARAMGAPAGQSAPAALYDLAAQIGAPTALSSIGLREDQLGQALGLVLDHVSGELPRPLEEAGLRQLLADAYAGRRPA